MISTTTTTKKKNTTQNNRKLHVYKVGEHWKNKNFWYGKNPKLMIWWFRIYVSEVKCFTNRWNYLLYFENCDIYVVQNSKGYKLDSRFVYCGWFRLSINVWFSEIFYGSWKLTIKWCILLEQHVWLNINWRVVGVQ